MDTESKKRMAIQLLEACDRGDAEMASNLITGDFHSEFMARSADGEASGDAELLTRLPRQEFLEQGVQVIKNVTRDGMHFTYQDCFGEGNMLALFGESHAASKTGKAYSNRYAWKFTFAGGKIRELNEYCDTKHAHEVLFA